MSFNAIYLIEGKYLMEGIPAKLHYNSLMFYLYPEKILMNDINKMYLVFYSLLIVSIFLITRHISGK